MEHTKPLPSPPRITHIFAAGCFSFVLKDPDSDIKWAEYIDGIRSGLESIDSIDSVKITRLDSFRTLPINPDHDGRFHNPPFFPCPSSGIVTFNIFIPKRVQEEVFSYRLSGLHCERFSVLISYDNNFPITLIRPDQNIDGDLSLGFSDAAPIVREYIMSRWNKDASVQFCAMGPSPFHAEFYVVKDDNNIGTNIVKRRRYDHIYHNSSKDDAVSKFAKECCFVLSNFYERIYLKNAFSDAEINLRNDVRSVLSRITERNVFKNIYNSFAFSNRKDIANIYSSNFELEEISSELRKLSYIRDKSDDSFPDSPLWTYVEDRESEYPKLAKDEVQGLVRLAEVFEMGGSNNFAILVAALASATLTVIATLGASLIN